MNKIAMLLFLSALGLSGIAQKNDSCFAGVYLTYDDFIKNKLSFKINTQRKGNNFGFVLLTHTIKVVTPDTTVKFSAGSIYGYNKCGSIYRYSPDVELLSPEDYYKIEEMGNEENKLTIYTSVFNGGAEHFFSTGLNMTIHRLNLIHLEKDFGALFPKFIEAVQKMKSGSDGKLTAKDSKGKFLINKLYQQFVTK